MSGDGPSSNYEASAMSAAAHRAIQLIDDFCHLLYLLALISGPICLSLVIHGLIDGTLIQPSGLDEIPFGAYVVSIYSFSFLYMDFVVGEKNKRFLWLHIGIALTLCIWVTVIDRSRARENRYWPLQNSILLYDETGGSAWNGTWDWLQYTKHCCGVHGYRDWSRNAYLKTVNKTVPDSCCDWKTEDRDACQASPESARLRGCYFHVIEDLLAHDKAIGHITLFIYFDLMLPFFVIIIIMDKPRPRRTEHSVRGDGDVRRSNQI